MFVYQSLQQILMALIPVSFVIFLGWLAGYRKIIDNRHSQSLATYVMSFSFPCGLFLLASGSKPQDLFNGTFVIAFWCGLMGMFALSYLLYKLVLRRTHRESAQGAFVCSFPDMAFMGIPIFTSLLGQNSMLSIAIGNICTSLIMIPIVTGILGANKDEKQSVQKILLSVATKPLVFAPVLGVLCSLLGLHIPELLTHSLSLIAGTTSGVSLFALGLIMSSFAVTLNRLVSFNIVLKNVVHPVIMVALVMLIGVKSLYAREAILLCAMPTATMTTMFALKYDTLTAESTSSAILGTVLSFLTLTVAMVLVGTAN